MEVRGGVVRTAATRAILAALAAMTLLVLASPAGAYVYWSNANGTIGRAKLDGTGVDQAFITGPTGPFEIATNASHVYWADYDGNSIGRAKIDGTGVDETFIPASGPRGIAVDGKHVYWTNDTGTIGRARLDGGDVDQSFVTGLDIPYGLAVDDEHLYWANYGTNSIGRVNIDGTGATPSLFSTAPGTPQGITVAGSSIYWADYQMVDPSAIGRAGLDGGNRNPTFIGGLSNPYGIAVDKNHVYWIDNTGDNAIGRANLDGGGIDSSFITGVDAWGVEVDGLPDRRPPKTRITDGPPPKTRKSTVRIAFRSSEHDSTFECRLDKSRWRTCRSPKMLRKLDRGEHVFGVRATDGAGNTDKTPAKARFEVVS